ncbi:MAG: DUF192 domain-containing protein [Methylobacterium sp.]
MFASLRQNRAVILIVVALVAVGYFVFTSQSSGSDATLVTATGRHPIAVEIADTPETREVGLMNRDQMDADGGMLFDFGESREVTMWMKNTLIPLDMLFLDHRGLIVRVAANARPLSLSLIPSNAPVQYVLELNGGAAARYGAKVGDHLEHPIITRPNTP